VSDSIPARRSKELFNSGDFQYVDDFSASIGDQEFQWADEESQFAFSDCMGE